MADNTKIWPIFRWANWWLSDDLFTGIQNSFYFSNDMEIRQDAKSIFPKPLPAYADPNTRISVWDASTGALAISPKCVFYSETDSAWIVCWEYNIYKVSWNSAVLLCTMNEIICDAEIFNGYIYVSTRKYLYYKKDNWWNRSDMAEATDATAENYGRCDDELVTNSNHPLYASDVILCVWNCNEMKKVTKEIYNLAQPWFTLQTWYYIRFINELWWYIRVVAVNEPYWSEVLLWDKVSDTPEEIIPLEWYSIIWATIYNWYHYLLSNKWLGLLNWYQYYLLKKVDWDINTSVRNCMCVYDDKLYFIANKWVYIYWAKNKNYADVLSLWHKVEDWFDLWAIGSYKNWIMITRSGHYSSTPSERVPIYVWVNEWTANMWELQTMCYFWTSMSEIKQSAYLRVGYHIPKHWNISGSVKVFYRTEADAIDDNPDDRGRHELTLHWWLTSDSDMRSPFATTLKLNCRFQRIQFKFVLNNCVWTDNWTVYSKDTNLYSADLYYNVMLD